MEHNDTKFNVVGPKEGHVSGYSTDLPKEARGLTVIQLVHLCLCSLMPDQQSIKGSIL